MALVIDNSDIVICFQAIFLEGVTGKLHCTTPEGTIYIEDNVNNASLEFFILATLLLPTLLYFELIFLWPIYLEGERCVWEPSNALTILSLAGPI